MTEKPIEPSGALTTDPHPVPLQAGPDLDYLVYEKVFGWEIDEEYGVWRDREGKVRGLVEETHPVSTEIGSAWEVVEKVDNRNSVAREMGVRIFTLNRYDEGYSASFFNADAHAETAPLAICLAALKAIGEVSQ